jgi:2-oxoglutarate dehydrogenase E2 component (dihydrolipoamide succinyltransferase)
MSPLRRTVARRLLEAQQNAAILTTFNEVDMTRVLQLREAHGEAFQKRHGVKLGFMSFFVKASVEALKAFPAVNAEVRGDAILYKDHYDVGVAVGGGKGLVVPVIRDADLLSFAEVEKALGELAAKARDNRIVMEDLAGGTFTISNGGIYGSLLSTPILNPPQSGILGMHKIEKRAVVGPGDQVVVRPMMYLALSYDHSIVDGREAVSFLIRVKECIEDPERICSRREPRHRQPHERAGVLDGTPDPELPGTCSPGTDDVGRLQPHGVRAFFGAAPAGRARPWRLPVDAVACPWSRWKLPIMAASSCACPESSVAAEEDSSELAAFCWVTLSISPTAVVTWAMPAACSRALAAISATISVTFVTEVTISASFAFTCPAVASPASFTDWRMSPGLVRGLLGAQGERAHSATTAKPRLPRRRGPLRPRRSGEQVRLEGDLVDVLDDLRGALG